jgi:hypothetical protein
LIRRASHANQVSNTPAADAAGVVSGVATARAGRVVGVVAACEGGVCSVATVSPRRREGAGSLRSFEFSTLARAVSGASARTRSAAVPAPLATHRRANIAIAARGVRATRSRFPSGKTPYSFFAAKRARRSRNACATPHRAAAARAAAAAGKFFLQNG